MVELIPKVIVSRKKDVSAYVVAILTRLNGFGEVEVEATGSAIERAIRAVDIVRQNIPVEEKISVGVVDKPQNGRVIKKAKINIRLTYKEES